MLVSEFGCNRCVAAAIRFESVTGVGVGDMARAIGVVSSDEDGATDVDVEVGDCIGIDASVGSRSMWRSPLLLVLRCPILATMFVLVVRWCTWRSASTPACARSVDEIGRGEAEVEAGVEPDALVARVNGARRRDELRCVFDADDSLLLKPVPVPIPVLGVIVVCEDRNGNGCGIGLESVLRWPPVGVSCVEESSNRVTWTADKERA